MSFGSGGGSSSIAGSSDVTLSNPATSEYLGYDAATSKWENQTLAGKAALANNGGREAMQDLGSKTGATTVNLTNGNVFKLTLSGNVTLTFSGAANNTACSFGLYVYGASGKTVTWPSSVKWANGTAPSLTGSSTSPDVLVFETFDGGTTWFGSLVGNNFS